MQKKRLLTLLLIIAGLGAYSQIGFNCQYVPGAQFGFVKTKSSKTELSSSHAAGLPLFMIDRFKNRWYSNMDMNALYYSVTQYNKSNRSKGDPDKEAKTEGGLFAGRIGYGFGKKEDFRVGPNVNLGYMMSNLENTSNSYNGIAGYWNFGGGVFAYKKINSRLRAMAKFGYEVYKTKKANDNIEALKGRGIYLEGTVAYNIYQKYGLSVMPAFYSKKFTFLYNKETATTESKIKSFVLRIGLTKFF